MGLKRTLKKLRDAYVIHQAERAKLPQFAPDSVVRYRILFRGRVQKVGFRLEVSHLAQRMDLTGFCRNLASGEVLAELQGEENRITFLIAFMEGLKRVRITEKHLEQIPLCPEETRFSTEM